MFRRLRDGGATLTIFIDGSAVQAKAGDTVAAALLLAGVSRFRRSAVSGADRGLYCGMGVCFECLVTINGAPNRQACLTVVEDRMTIETGHGAPLPSGRIAP